MGVDQIENARGVVLDRDGTLIDVVRDEETGVITTAFHPSQLRLLPGVVEGLLLLRDAGFVFAIATNQPGPAKGHFTVDAVTRTNDALVTILAGHGITIARVKSCVHHPSGAPGGDPNLVGPCDCRKPKPGLLNDIARDLSLDRAASWMIGDTTSDLEAGRAAGMRTGLLFATNRCELCPLRAAGAAAECGATPPGKPDVHGASLPSLARAILAAV